jgi:hypothetical protein
MEIDDNVKLLVQLQKDMLAELKEQTRILKELNNINPHKERRIE